MYYRYLIYDVIEWDFSEGTKPDLIGRANDKATIKQIIKGWNIETDGECNIWIWDKERKDWIELELIK